MAGTITEPAGDVSVRRRLGTWLAWGYGLGLSVLAVVMSLFWLSFDRLLESHRGVALEINVAGRQRMLSQRIGFVASELERADNTVAPALRQLLAACADQMLRAQDALAIGNGAALQAASADAVTCRPNNDQPAAEAPIAAALTPRVPADTALDREIRAFAMAAKSIAEAATAQPGAVKDLLGDALWSLPQQLDARVERIEQEGQAAVTRLQRTNLLLLLATLGLLGLEALLVFRPLTRMVQRGAGELQRKLAEEVGLRQRAETAAQAKAAFLSTMSHDLRTPLNAIIGMSDILRQEMFGRHASAHYQEYSQDIYDAGLHLLHLIDCLLEAGSVGLGNLTLSNDRVELGLLIRELDALFRPMARAANGNISLVPGPRIVVTADRVLLARAAKNLVENALRFGHGEISLSYGLTPAAEPFVEVHDNGPGLPPPILEQIRAAVRNEGAEPHFSNGQGSGFGLPIVSQIATRHGGRLEALVPTVGARLRIVLPNARLARAAVTGDTP